MNRLALYPAEPPLIIGSVQSFGPNQLVYREGDRARLFFKINSGVIRVSGLLSDGRRHIDAFLTSGAVFGLSTDETYRLTAEAVGDCTLVTYKWPGFAALTAVPNSLAQRLCGHVILALARAQDHALLLARPAAIEKIAAFILEWSDAAPDRSKVVLVMTRVDIADYLGLTVETVSRTFTELRQRDLIIFDTARELRLPDLPGLRALLN